MINPIELRLGNYFVERGEFDMVNANTWQRTSYDDMLPIPLVPEILEMAGFKKTGDQVFAMRTLDVEHLKTEISVKFNPSFDIGYEVTQWYCSINEDGGLETAIPMELPHIQYLHQLQNLIFALTGEELDINL